MLRVAPCETLRFLECNNNEVGIHITCCCTVPVIYKIQTNAPEKFRVRPRCGVLEPKQTVHISIVLKPDFQLNEYPKDKFLILGAVAPLECDLSTQQRVSEVWKRKFGNIHCAGIEQHRLTCIYGTKEQLAGVQQQQQQTQEQQQRAIQTQPQPQFLLQLLSQQPQPQPCQPVPCQPVPCQPVQCPPCPSEPQYQTQQQQIKSQYQPQTLSPTQYQPPSQPQSQYQPETKPQSPYNQQQSQPQSQYQPQTQPQIPYNQPQSQPQSQYQPQMQLQNPYNQPQSQPQSQYNQPQSQSQSQYQPESQPQSQYNQPQSQSQSQYQPQSQLPSYHFQTPQSPTPQSPSLRPSFQIEPSALIQTQTYTSHHTQRSSFQNEGEAPITPQSQRNSFQNGNGNGNGNENGNGSSQQQRVSYQSDVSPISSSQRRSFQNDVPSAIQSYRGSSYPGTTESEYLDDDTYDNMETLTLHASQMEKQLRLTQALQYVTLFVLLVVSVAVVFLLRTEVRAARIPPLPTIPKPTVTLRSKLSGTLNMNRLRKGANEDCLP